MDGFDRDTCTDVDMTQIIVVKTQEEVVSNAPEPEVPISTHESDEPETKSGPTPRKFTSLKELPPESRDNSVRPHTCTACSKTFISNAKLKQHVTRRHFTARDGGHTCNLCQETVGNHGNAMDHFTKRHSPFTTTAAAAARVYKCGDCDAQFASSYALCGHRKSHSENRRQSGKYECKLCFTTLMVSSSLRRHYRICHGMELGSKTLFDGPFPCARCNIVFDKCDDLKEHSSACGLDVTEHGQRFFCELCNKAFAKLWQLEKHKRGHVSAEWKFHCDDCQLGFTEEAKLELHRSRRECRGKQHVCDTCGKQFQTQQNLKRHRREIHGGSDDGDVIKERRFQCPVCDKTFVQKGHLNRHLTLHSDNPRPHVCDICRKAFAEMHQLRRHLLIHTGDHPEKCPDCGAAFRTVYELNQHRQMHASATNGGEASNFECEFCGRRFPLRSRLIAHARVHTDEKPYACAVCPARFKYFHGLYKHKLTHVRDSPGVTCERCAKTFRDKIGLAGHVKHVHAERKRMACEKCGKCFHRLSDLHAHRRIWKQPHACAHCCRTYLSKDALGKHVRMLHGRKRPFVCPTCQQRHAERQEMIDHIQEAHLVKEKFNMYLCNYPKCSRSFMTRHHLERHLCTHRSKSGAKKTADKKDGPVKQTLKKRAGTRKSLRKLLKKLESPPQNIEQNTTGDDSNCGISTVHIVNLYPDSEYKKLESPEVSDLPQLLPVGDIKQEPTYDGNHGNMGNDDEEGACMQIDVVYSLKSIGSVTILNARVKESPGKSTCVACGECGAEFSSGKLLDIHQMVHAAD